MARPHLDQRWPVKAFSHVSFPPGHRLSQSSQAFDPIISKLDCFNRDLDLSWMIRIDHLAQCHFHFHLFGFHLQILFRRRHICFYRWPWLDSAVERSHRCWIAQRFLRFQTGLFVILVSQDSFPLIMWPLQERREEVIASLVLVDNWYWMLLNFMNYLRRIHFYHQYWSNFYYSLTTICYLSWFFQLMMDPINCSRSLSFADAYATFTIICYW